jgi:hypothetical protein
MHASPGRLRVKMDRDAFESNAVRNAEEALTGVDGVLEVRRNPASRSVLVRYDVRAASLPRMFAAVAGAGVAIDVPTTASSTSEAPALGNLITSAFSRADEWVSGRTSRKADLRTLVPVGLAALAARELLVGRAVSAPWYVLAWYAFDSFYKLRRDDSGSTPPSN